MQYEFMHFKYLAIFFAITLTFLPIFSCARPVPTSQSELESVEIAQSSVKSQHKIGFCWAYATIGLIESNYKVSNGHELNLSEEALGYARMKEEMLQLAKSVRSGRITRQMALNATQGDGLEGWYVRVADGDQTRDAMELVDDYGLVPEEIWSVKFRRVEDVTNLKQALLHPFFALLSGTDAITPAAIDTVLTSPGAFPSTPPTTVVFNQVSLSPVQFASQVLRFHSRDYVAMRSSSASDMSRLMRAMKRSMAAGYSVPLSFAVSFENLQGGYFRAPNYEIAEYNADPSLAPSLLNVVGGHAVLATDFVNRGGSEGEVTPEELQAELAKGSEEIDYVKFKNSWGTNGSTSEGGHSVTSGEDGYYRMDAGYIKANAAIGRLGVVVPRQFTE